MDVRIRDWTFTHFWVRPVVKLWFDRYHKSVSYSGESHVNWQKPLIFAPSHQSAFTDALCLILPARYTNDRFIYPLVRADAFGKSNVQDWVLTSFHMLPVYRPKDNVDIKMRNDSVFADCREILSKNRNLLIHPEGNCYAIKKVRRFKKGLARIAFGAEEINNFDLDIQIVPVGINYRKVTGARGGIHIRYGNPIKVKDYQRTYIEHPATALTELTRDLELRVKEVTVDIQADVHYSLVENIVQLAKKRNPLFAGRTNYSKEEVAYEKEVIENVEATLQQSSDSAGELQKEMGKLLATLDEFNLNIEQSLIERYSALRLAAEGVGGIILLPVFIYGWINNIIPWYLIHRLAERIEDGQFINSARMASGLMIFPLFYIIQTLTVWLISDDGLWALIYFLSLPFAGFLSLNLYERWKEWRQQMRLQLMSEERKSSLFASINNLFTKLGIR